MVGYSRMCIFAKELTLNIYGMKKIMVLLVMIVSIFSSCSNKQEEYEKAVIGLDVHIQKHINSYIDYSEKIPKGDTTVSRKDVVLLFMDTEYLLKQIDIILNHQYKKESITEMMKIAKEGLKLELSIDDYESMKKNSFRNDNIKGAINSYYAKYLHDSTTEIMILKEKR